MQYLFILPILTYVILAAYLIFSSPNHYQDAGDSAGQTDTMA
jgi:hypothetical protein